MANERLENLRRLMQEKNIDVYLVPTDDFHGSEYVSDHFKCRAFLTGFTGSAGTAVVTLTDALLWTDGRYFLQAEKQLENSGFTLCRSEEKGVPTVNEWIEDHLSDGKTLGFDGRVVNAKKGRDFEAIAKRKNARIESAYDLVGVIWSDRPAMPHTAAWILDLCYAGETVPSKISRIREEMKKLGATVHLLTSLEDIAWTLNLRGDDVKHCPVILSYLIVTENDCTFFVQEEALCDHVRRYLSERDVKVRPYEDVYEAAASYADSAEVILLDPNKVNDRLMRLIGNQKTVEKMNPTVLMKAVKNETEQENVRRAHLEDGVAMVKWLCWLSDAVKKETHTELSVSEKLREFRASRPGFVDISFETIAGYKEHGAIIHYSATEESDVEIKPEGLLLVDSGGHYVFGTTDITRTVAMGPLSDEEKEIFTLVAKSHLSLLPLKFKYGCTGLNFDLLVREPLWERGLDYRHGTGHGVGYLLSVHEMPNGFRYRISPDRIDSAVFEDGMVTTDEPGLYLDDKFGVRIESELLCKKTEETEYGQFMEFENLTLCPIDLDAILPDMLTEKEKDTLNRYHETVFTALSPYLTEKEKVWLKQATRRI